MNIPQDKLLHLAAGTLVALVAFFATGSGLLAFVACAVIGLGKEYLYDRDRQDAHTVDPLDAAYTAAPGAVVWALAALFA